MLLKEKDQVGLLLSESEEEETERQGKEGNPVTTDSQKSLSTFSRTKVEEKERLRRQKEEETASFYKHKRTNSSRKAGLA
ncbi:hypothetical protein Tco_1276060 [Tanacetum coccineum]